MKCFNASSSAWADGRSPHGERGLKFHLGNEAMNAGLGRSPHGERGLKYLIDEIYENKLTVAPRTGSVD